MATLKDLSRETGLSVTQVSRALGGHADVSEATRRRVRAAADRLRYRPNAVARALASGRSGIVAVVVSAPDRAEDGALMMEIVAGLSAEFSRHGQRFVLHVLGGESASVAHERLYREGGIDGFVVLDPARGDPRLETLRAIGAPHVVHGRDPGGDRVFVDIDNRAVAERMARHLLDLGHRRVGFLNGPDGRGYAMARQDGFAAALAGAGATEEEALVHRGEMNEAVGLRVGLSWLTRDRPPTAIVAGNRALASGVYAAARVLDVAIPSQLSVLAHDDGLRADRARRFDPPLGGTSAQLSEAWATVARSLAAAIEGERPASAVLDQTFAAGSSTAPPTTGRPPSATA